MDKLERRVISNNIVPAELIPATATTTADTSKRIKNIYIPLTNKYNGKLDLTYKKWNNSMPKHISSTDYYKYWCYGQSDLENANVVLKDSSYNYVFRFTGGSSLNYFYLLSPDKYSAYYYSIVSGDTNNNNKQSLNSANQFLEEAIANDGTWYAKCNFSSKRNELYLKGYSGNSDETLSGPYIDGTSTFTATDGTNQTLYPYFEYVD